MIKKRSTCVKPTDRRKLGIKIEIHQLLQALNRIVHLIISPAEKCHYRRSVVKLWLPLVSWNNSTTFNLLKSFTKTLKPYRKWVEPRSISISYSVIVRVRVVRLKIHFSDDAGNQRRLGINGTKYSSSTPQFNRPCNLHSTEGSTTSNVF